MFAKTLWIDQCICLEDEGEGGATEAEQGLEQGTHQQMLPREAEALLITRIMMAKLANGLAHKVRGEEEVPAHIAVLQRKVSSTVHSVVQ